MAHDPFATLYDRYYDGMRRTLRCFGVPPSALDDALQELFLVVHRRLREDHGHDIPREWIYGVARRVAWRLHRTTQRVGRRAELAAVPASPEPPDDAIAREEAVAFMIGFLDTLPDEQRVVFVLAEIESLTAREVSTVVDASPNTVSSRLRLARARFSSAIAARQGADEEVSSGR